MFDVIWTDPNRELVGERMLRKELEGKGKDENRSKSRKTRPSVSPDGSSSSSERGFGFFSTKGRKKTRTPSKARSGLTPPKLSTGEDCASQRLSTYAVKSLLTHEDDSEVTVKPARAPCLSDSFPDGADACSSQSSRDSAFSKWTEPSASTTGTVSGSSLRHSIVLESQHQMETLGPSSFITRSEEVVSSMMDPSVDACQPSNEVHIFADQTRAEAHSPQALSDEGSSSLSPLVDRDSAALCSSPWSFDARDASLVHDQPPRTPSPVEKRRKTTPSITECSSLDRIGNPDAWKPPDEWDCTPTKDNPKPSIEEPIRYWSPYDVSEHYMSPNRDAVQRQVRMMATASTDLILANLLSDMGNVSDATDYRELEKTKKRWLLAALHQTESYGVLNACRPPTRANPSSPQHRILALYETQATASFMAALYPNLPISHLSPDPISPYLFPNVQPILAPVVSAPTASRQLPDKFFSAVTCLAMPAVFHASEIPQMFRETHRCLATGGALYLTLIDPQPMPTTTGPKLRQWLLDHLLVHLEDSYRTINPNRVFPPWLTVGRLRARGSTITTASVQAVPEERTEEESATDTVMQRELRSVVSRLLWKEVWGKFVKAKTWWWEEDEIIQECRENHTMWLHSHIISIKEDE